MNDLRENAWRRLVKQSDETRTADSTAADDAALKFTVVPGKSYIVRAQVFFDTTAAADFKYRHTLTATASVYRLRRRAIIPGGTAYAGIAIQTAASVADIAVTTTSTGSGVVELDLCFTVSDGGTWAFQWAQNTSDASNTTVLAGSYLEYICL